MIEALDNWLKGQGGTAEVVAQIGRTDYKPRHLEYVASLSPDAFREAVRRAEVIVAHAGMGSVLTAMEFGKPLVVLPRLGALQETRNDHQVATANWLSTKPGVFVAMNEAELGSTIDRARSQSLRTTEISPFASPKLITALRTFILDSSVSR
jgi:UDP-N-acetylglucosamine transferase subunit ALG13